MSKRSYIELVRAITCTFMQRFQNSVAQLLFLRRKSPIKTFLGMLKVKVTGVK